MIKLAQIIFKILGTLMKTIIFK